MITFNWILDAWEYAYLTEYLKKVKEEGGWKF